MPKPNARDKRILVRELKKRRASPFQVTAATILLHAVGLPAAMLFLRGPRQRFLRSAGEVRRYLARHGVTDKVCIMRLGLHCKPLFVVRYADIELVKVVRFAARPAGNRRANDRVSVKGRVRLHSTKNHHFKVKQLARILSRTANVIAAGCVSLRRRS
jgi:hypothetical protein